MVKRVRTSSRSLVRMLVRSVSHKEYLLFIWSNVDER